MRLFVKKTCQLFKRAYLEAIYNTYHMKNVLIAINLIAQFVINVKQYKT